jgi:hypothetical protein
VAAMATKAATITIPIVCRRVLVAFGFVLGLTATLPAEATTLWDWAIALQALLPVALSRRRTRLIARAFT